MGMDTHALSEPAFVSALEVLAANGVEVMIDRDRGYTPTPVISHAILRYNRGRTSGLADGIVITPSHNPPEDGGFKYNPPTGGPADTDVTGWIEQTANALLADGLRAVRRMPYERARRAATTHLHDYIGPYVDDLASVVDMEAIRSAGVRIGVDPLGGAGVHYWEPIVARYGIAVTVVNDAVDPTFRFMTVDWDGKIRTDCSSPYAMVPLVAMRDRFDVAFANDADHDRHGIVTPTAGLMNPNHYLAVAISYLFTHRPAWSTEAAVGKTVVSSGMIDRVTKGLGRRLLEVPVGFKWFVDGLLRRIARLRRRGKRRGVVPAHRRHDVDHRQGRHHPRPARGGDHGDAWRRSRSPLRRADPRVRRAGVRADRCARDAGAEDGCLAAALPRSGRREGAGGRRHPRDPDDRAWQRRIDRRPESRSPTTAGLPCARPARRTCTSCTRRVSAIAPHLERIQAEAQALVTTLFKG